MKICQERGRSCWSGQGRGCPRDPHCHCHGYLPEHEAKTLLLKTPRTSVTGLGRLELVLAWEGALQAAREKSN